MARILVCEDSATQALHLKVILESGGHEVVMAKDGQEGFDIIGTTNFDIVLSDVQMPRLTGFDLCRKIRFELRDLSLPIVLLTTLNEMDDLLRGRDVGASTYIVKPYQPDDLLRRLEKLLVTRPNKSEPAAASQAGAQNASAAPRIEDTTRTPAPAAAETPAPARVSPPAPPLPPPPPPPESMQQTLSAKSVASPHQLGTLLDTICTLSEEALSSCYDPMVVDKLMAINEAARQAQLIAPDARAPQPTST